MKKILLLLCSLLACQPVLAQQDVPKPGAEVTFHYGIVFAGSGRSIAEQMKKNGFGEDLSYGSYLSEDNPLRDESAYQLGVLVPIKNNFKIKGLVHYRKTDVKGSSSLYHPATLNTAVYTTAAIAYAPLETQQFRIGAGPAYHWANATVISRRNVMNFNNIGLVMESGGNFPANSQFFIDLQLQYFYVGKEDLGTHTIWGADNAGSPVSTIVEFSNTSFSSLIFSIGAGVRLNKM